MPTEEGGFTLPIFDWLNDPIKKSIKQVFDDLNDYTEALDIFKKYRKNHLGRLRKQVEYIKVLGMNEPVNLLDVYSSTFVSTTIHRRLYEQDWLNAGKPEEYHPLKKRFKVKPVRGDDYIENHDRVVVLGAPGSGKTTFLRHLTSSYCDKEIF